MSPPAPFDEFAAAQITPLLRYATVLTCDPHLAQDVVQECLLRAHHGTAAGRKRRWWYPWAPGSW